MKVQRARQSGGLFLVFENSAEHADPASAAGPGVTQQMVALGGLQACSAWRNEGT